ncbi:MAG: TonB-dependent receptor [Ignavibacteria bacterium]|jgi:iron complex outermembrane receptor protein|nr:TonB-dependent receptor [Ignavibacteria bacterium]MCU7504105.1 TonB-dependent receptor [Ignavibacteria bacterium]MCU7516445.1 TonB-dependent receptor [Ignavibacteria bacterium]
MLLFSGAWNVAAQTGTIYGKITDLKGSPLAGANVVVLGTTTGTSTDTSGTYRLSGLKPGIYRLEISMIGYRKSITGEVELRKTPVELNFTLEETALQSKQVVVTASKYEQQLSELPVSASILSSAEITNRNVVSLDYALRYAPGVNMNMDQVSIRGSSGYSRGAGTRVLVAMDGIPLYTGDTGEIIYEIIPVTQIDRVEIIKGAASSLYGSTAIGGVINVITKSIDEKPQLYLKTYYGLYDHPSYKEWDWSGERRPFNGQTLTHSNSFGSLGYVVSFTRSENLGYRQDDYYKRYTGFIKTDYRLSRLSSLTFLGSYLGQNRGNFIYWKDSRHALQPRDIDQGQKVKSNRYMLALMYSNVLSPDFFLKLRTSYYRTRWLDETSSHDTSTTGLLEGELQSSYRIMKSLFVTSGVEAGSGKVNSNLFGKPGSFNIGVYLQTELKFSFPLRLTLGARYDFSRLDTLKGFGSFSPKAALNYALSENTSFRASVGKGFRAPTLAETFTSTTAGGIKIKPNPHLEPENSISMEIGINHRFSSFIASDIALFQNEYYHFIEPGVDPVDGLVTFRNLTRARIQGLESNFTFSLIPERLLLSANYTYLWARDIEKKTPLKYRPRHQALASLNYYSGWLEFGTDFRYWSKIEALDFELVDLGVVTDGDKRVPVYLLDFRTGYNLLSLGLPGKVFLNINNLLNYNYIEIIGNLSPIRNASLSLEFSF